MPLTPATTAPRTLSGLALMLSTGLATCLTGCATQSGSQPNQGQRAGQPGNAGIISTPVDVSKLREEAIAIVEQMAANPDGAVRADWPFG